MSITSEDLRKEAYSLLVRGEYEKLKLNMAEMSFDDRVSFYDEYILPMPVEKRAKFLGT